MATAFPSITAREFLAGAAPIAIRAMRIPMTNSRYEATVETPEGVTATFPLSRLDLARFKRTLASSPARVAGDCMGRVTVALHGYVAEFSARGVILSAAA